MKSYSIPAFATIMLLSACETPLPPPPPAPPPEKKMDWCPPEKKKPATPKPEEPKKSTQAANSRLRDVNGRTIEDVPPEEVEPVKSVLDIKR